MGIHENQQPHIRSLARKLLQLFRCHVINWRKLEILKLLGERRATLKAARNRFGLAVTIHGEKRLIARLRNAKHHSRIISYENFEAKKA